MSRWNETEFVQRAGRLAHDHVVLKTPLNELAEKVARDENLQPDEIRTLVRLANVATFQELFKRKDDGDKNIEFVTGDPEHVIQHMTDAVNNPPETANVNNTKTASEWQVPDQMAAKRLGHAFDPAPTVKVAADETEPPPMRRDLALLYLRKIANEFELERISTGTRWEEALTKIAREFRKAPGYGQVFSEFERDALTMHGADAQPELVGIRETLKLSTDIPALTKVAQLQATHIVADTPQLRLLKEAIDLRAQFEKFEAGLNWIKNHAPGEVLR
jgi:hypothetical protein